MSEVRTWFADGGYTMIALSVLAVVLLFLILERFLATGAGIRKLALRGPRPGLESADTVRLAGLRRVGLIRSCIVIAPLLGLLGTVTGMIDTFESILRGGYIAEMSDGIRKALLTTQYGLAIAAPGLIAERVLLNRIEKLARLARTSPGLDGEEA